MKKSKVKKTLTVLSVVILLSLTALYGLYLLSEHFGNEMLENRLNSLETYRFPNSFKRLHEKFGDDLEVMHISEGGPLISITYKYSEELESKYNTDGLSQVEFLQYIANEWVDCFHDEIIENLEKDDFIWPLGIGFYLGKGSEYELITFRYDDFDECSVIYHEKW